MQPKEDFISQPLSHPSEIPKSQKQWVCKGDDVIQEDFYNLWTINRLFTFDEWIEISLLLEERFKVKVIINPLFVDKAIIKFKQGNVDDVIKARENGKTMGNFTIV